MDPRNRSRVRFGAEDADTRSLITAQWSLERKRVLAGVVIINRGGLPEVEAAVNAAPGVGSL